MVGLSAAGHAQQGAQLRPLAFGVRSKAREAARRGAGGREAAAAKERRAAYGMPPASLQRKPDLRVAACTAGGAGVDVEQAVLLGCGASPLDGGFATRGEHLQGAHRQ